MLNFLSKKVEENFENSLAESRLTGKDKVHTPQAFSSSLSLSQVSFSSLSCIAISPPYSTSNNSQDTTLPTLLPQADFSSFSR
jgi:hypothetical protein